MKTPQHPELTAEMAKRRIQKKQIAALLGITYKTLDSRLYGRSSFTLAEAKKLHETFFPDVNFVVFRKTAQ